MDGRNYVIGVFVDIKKAFDSVSHDILLQKLQHYSIRGLALNWFSSYLHDRKQFVFSKWDQFRFTKNMSIWCLSGINSWPSHFFLIVINDIHTSIKCSKIKLCVDDTDCFFAGKDFKTLIRETVFREVSSLHHWVNCK